MTKNLIILALVTMNLVFAWAFMQSSSSAKQVPEPSNPFTNAQPAAQTTNGAASTLQTKPVASTEIDSLEYSSSVEQLRQQGFSEDTIRQLMLAQINEDYLRTQIDSSATPYWLPNENDAEAKLSEALQWEADRRQQLIDLFGNDIVDDPLFTHIFKPLNSTLSFLSSDKQIRLDELQRLDEARTRALFQNGFTEESRDDLAAQRAQLQREITELLGTTDDFEYQLRESRLAERMRRGLGSFDYSEQEFRDIFSIRQEVEGNQSNGFLMDRSEFRRQREESEARIRSYLGDTRYQEFARSQDPAYRSLQSIGERYGNTTAEIDDVYTITQETEQKIDELRASNTMDREERIEKINEIRSEAYEQIEQIAGKDTAESVQENARRLGFGRRFGGPRPPG